MLPAIRDHRILLESLLADAFDLTVLEGAAYCHPQCMLRVWGLSEAVIKSPEDDIHVNHYVGRY